MTVLIYSLIREYGELFDYYLEWLDRLSDDQKKILNARMRNLDERILFETENLEGFAIHQKRYESRN